MQQHPYFETNRVVVLAHRGMTPPAENTLEAFQNALAAGADYLESDIRTSSDGVAVLAHDEDLQRVFGLNKKVNQLSFAELQKLKPTQGGQFISLEEALRAFPKANFNLDIKEEAAIKPTVRVIEELSAHNRVLVSSFSNKRRLAALQLFSKPVATSASASVIIKAMLLHLFRQPLDRLLTGIGAIQVPMKMYGMNFTKASFIKRVKATNTQIHFWTINDPAEIKRLIGLGADGIVTDNTDMAVEIVEKF